MITVVVFIAWHTTMGQPIWPYDYTKASIALEIDPYQETLQGKVRYSFKATKQIDSLYLDARGMTFDDVQLNGRSVQFNNDGRRLVVWKALRPGKKYRLELHYKAQPKQAVYFLGWTDTIPGNEQIWTQGQGKYSSHWVPSPDLMEEKVTFSTTIAMDTLYEVVANGKLTKNKTVKGRGIWSYKMNATMSSYLLAFAVGDYEVKRIESASGIPIFLYTYPQDKSKWEPTYRYTREIFDYLEAEIGIPYPWQNYKQVPVRDFLYAGMENTGTTFFSDGYVVDSTAFSDLNYVNVNAHELAHQWFGNLVTETDAAQHWLHEGLATYYAYMAERELFGDEHFYWKLYDTASQLKAQDEVGEGEALDDPGASSLTFYEKGAWAALMLRETIGNHAWRRGIREFLNRYAFQNATLSDFFTVMEASCGCSLEEFRAQWFEANSFPYQESLKFLQGNSEQIGFYQKLQQELITSTSSNEEILEGYWSGISSTELKRRIILQYGKTLSAGFLEKVAGEGDPRVRQAVALSLPTATPETRELFESLLGDPSYLTKENALYKLWVSFPEERKHYLELTRGEMGLPNKSLRMTWLLLARLTQDFENGANRAAYEQELRGYTAPHHGFEIRQNAFAIIQSVLGVDKRYLKDLSQACTHHAWQFRKFARNLMEELLKRPVVKERLIQLKEQLGKEEQAYLKSILKS